MSDCTGFEHARKKLWSFFEISPVYVPFCLAELSRARRPAAVVLSQKALRSNSLIRLTGWSEGWKTDRTLPSLILNHGSTAYVLLSLFPLLRLVLMTEALFLSRSAPKQSIHKTPVPQDPAGSVWALRGPHVSFRVNSIETKTGQMSKFVIQSEEKTFPEHHGILDRDPSLQIYAVTDKHG